ncbi:phage portal protein [Levilactobacillus tangyuanensis]|uniref:Phage portal protein n=1 Tax=Levilactobacillus tangyuanensis TaxID=2486021 RepID=A0ABW1TP42_9LACO|nr:phage portal protein [Levilactobacillus tangyuanensis]
MQNYFAVNNQDFLLSGMPLRKSDQAGDSETKLSENVTIDDDDVFLYPRGLDIKEHLEDVFSIVAYHDSFIAPKYKMKREYYKGRHYDIIHKDKKPLNKPDHRLIINLPKKLVNTFNGYFSGDPVSIKHQSDSTDDEALNESIQDWLNDNDAADTFSEWSKQADIFGRGYLYAYLDDGELRFTVCSPRDTIVVYDDSVMHRPVFGIRYSTTTDGLIPTLITRDANFDLKKKDGKIVLTNASDEDSTAVSKNDMHRFPELPLIELAEDEERTGIFDDVISLIDAIDSVQSSKGNDITSFADAYLVITGQKISEDQIKDIQDNRLINLWQQGNSFENNTGYGEQSAAFLTPASNDDTQENFLNRAIDMVYQISQVVNLNDSSMGMSAQSISGVALLQRYQPMQAKARTKALKMDKALRLLFTILFDFWGNPKLHVSDLTFDHKQSIPHNLSEEADIVTKLNGQVDDATKLSFFSGIDNPQKAVERLKDQQDEETKQAQSQMQKYLNDQQKGGVADGESVDDNGSAGASKNGATDKNGQSVR